MHTYVELYESTYGGPSVGHGRVVGGDRKVWYTKNSRCVTPEDVLKVGDVVSLKEKHIVWYAEYCKKWGFPVKIAGWVGEIYDIMEPDEDRSRPRPLIKVRWRNGNEGICELKEINVESRNFL